MNRLELKSNEYTDQSFLAFLKKKLRKKSNVNGKDFTINDVNQYCKKGKIPNAYGGAKLTISYVLDKLRIITVEGEVKHQPKKTKLHGKGKKV